MNPTLRHNTIKTLLLLLILQTQQGDCFPRPVAIQFFQDSIFNPVLGGIDKITTGLGFPSSSPSRGQNNGGRGQGSNDRRRDRNPQPPNRQTPSETRNPSTDYLSSASFSKSQVEQISNLCPELRNPSRPEDWRYHNETRKCYKIGNNGPCGTEMTFYQQIPNSIFGICECGFTNRMLVYDSQSNSCYKIYSQGYCATGEWLELTPKGNPICKRNPCFNWKTPNRSQNNPFTGYADYEEIVPFKGTCAILNQPSIHCLPSQIVSFVDKKLKPTCSSSGQVIPEKSIGVPPTPCSPGYSRTVFRTCQVAFDWDFD